MLMLLPHFGLIGAAYALLLSTTFRFALIVASFPIVLKMPLPNLLPNREDVRLVRHALQSR
jgi:hypothetical protein